MGWHRVCVVVGLARSRRTDAAIGVTQFTLPAFSPHRPPPQLYLVLLFTRVLVGWFPTFPYWDQQPWMSIRQVTDPYLRFFTGIIPPLLGTIDITPMVGFAVLQVRVWLGGERGGRGGRCAPPCAGAPARHRRWGPRQGGRIHGGGERCAFPRAVFRIITGVVAPHHARTCDGATVQTMPPMHSVHVLLP